MSGLASGGYCHKCQTPIPVPVSEALSDDDILVCGGCLGIYVYDGATKALRPAEPKDFDAMSEQIRTQAIRVRDYAIAQQKRVARHSRHWRN